MTMFVADCLSNEQTKKMMLLIEIGVNNLISSKSFTKFNLNESRKKKIKRKKEKSLNLQSNLVEVLKVLK